MKANPSKFAPGTKTKLELSIEDYQTSAKEDFKLSYAISADYYDSMPPSVKASVTYKVSKTSSGALGSVEMNGKQVKYTIKATNIQESKGLGMTIAILRVPSCLKVNFNMLEALKSNGMVDQYEVRKKNTEIVMYWRQMKPGEVKTVEYQMV